jgi:hypothetical protein
MLKLLIIAAVVFAGSAVVAVGQQRWKARRVLKARLALVQAGPLPPFDPDRLAVLDDRPECPRGHGHMKRLMDDYWYCSGCGCGYDQKCSCGAWIPTDWHRCIVCGEKRRQHWL